MLDERHKFVLDATMALNRQPEDDLAAFIREARERQGWSQTELAIRAETDQQTIDRLERRITKSSRALPRILEALGAGPAVSGGLSLPAPLVPITPVRSAGRFPIYGAAQGGDGNLVMSFDPVDYVAVPGPLANVKNAYGMYVVGDSMSPAFEPGDVALVHPHQPARGNDDVVLYRAMHGQTHLIIKRLLRSTAENWTLRQFNPAMDFDVARSDWSGCHLIVGKYSRR